MGHSTTNQRYTVVDADIESKLSHIYRPDTPAIRIPQDHWSTIKGSYLSLSSKTRCQPATKSIISHVTGNKTS
jgi:hypothetical protein